MMLVEALYSFPPLFRKHRRPDEPLSNIYYQGPEREHSTPLMPLCIATLCALKGEPRSKKAETLMTDSGERKSICVCDFTSLLIQKSATSTQAAPPRVLNEPCCDVRGQTCATVNAGRLPTTRSRLAAANAVQTAGPRQTQRAHLAPGGQTVIVKLFTEAV